MEGAQGQYALIAARVTSTTRRIYTQPRHRPTLFAHTKGRRLVSRNQPLHSISSRERKNEGHNSRRGRVHRSCNDSRNGRPPALWRPRHSGRGKFGRLDAGSAGCRESGRGNGRGVEQHKSQWFQNPRLPCKHASNALLPAAEHRRGPRPHHRPALHSPRLFWH